MPFGYLTAIADTNNATANINSANWSDNSILIEVAYQATRVARGTVDIRSVNSAYNDAMGVARERSGFLSRRSLGVLIPISVR